VLTEGVVPYLSVEEVAALADDLHAQSTFSLWVTDYFSPLLLRYVKRRHSMTTVPIRFDPPDWDAFFAHHGWRAREMRYLGEESLRVHRPVPMPLFVRVLRTFSSKARRRQMLRNAGYALLAPS
jgi:O-methyltransferase involved in polyketide biosynthesis